MRYLRYTLYVLFMMFSYVHGEDLPEKSIVVVIPSYNNVNWLQRNLESVLQQNYSNFRIIYVNDCSKDNTGTQVRKVLKRAKVDYQVINFDDSNCNSIPEATEKFINTVNKQRVFCTLVNNVHRCGALANLYRAIYSCDDDEIIVTLDGDDWFYHTQVLSQLNEVYTKEDVWFTHGALKEYPSGNVTWCEPIPQEYIEKGAFREFKCPSHLRTFYTWIFKRIKLEDLLYEGKFFAMTWDFAIMFPIAEMAGKRHAFIADPNYVYNMANQINDNRVNAGLQNYLDKFIRNKERYQCLEGEIN